MALSVTWLMLSHFRSHLRAQLELDHRPVAIYGANGSGKTNLIEAVSLLSAGRGLRRAQSAELNRRPEKLGWKIQAHVTRDGRLHEIETSAEPDKPRLVRIDEKTASQTALSHIAPMLWLVPAMDRLWIEGAEGRRRFFDRMTMSFHPDHGPAVLSYEKAMRERNRLLRDQIDDPRWYSALEARMAEAGAEIEANRSDALDQIHAAQETAKSSFPAADLALTQSETPEREEGAPALAEALARSRPADLRAGRSLTGPHRADLAARYRAKDMPAAQCSTGEQKALLISLILANCRALAAKGNPAPILLLDEVAAHLDADRRVALFDEITALGAQAWMTGTGPELFEALGPRAQWFAVTDDGGRSHVRPQHQS
ncbi:MAG: DNA replication/repair protein RecF [Pseudomonadota bacterium]